MSFKVPNWKPLISCNIKSVVQDPWKFTRLVYELQKFLSSISVAISNSLLKRAYSADTAPSFTPKCSCLWLNFPLLLLLYQGPCPRRHLRHCAPLELAVFLFYSFYFGGRWKYARGETILQFFLNNCDFFFTPFDANPLQKEIELIRNQQHSHITSKSVHIYLFNGPGLPMLCNWASPLHTHSV